MKEPVFNKQCGHVFERKEIEGWRAKRIAEQKTPVCPLCPELITELVQNILLREALEVLGAPENIEITRLEDLTEDEQLSVQRAANMIVQRRDKDKRAQPSIPDRLHPRQSFVEQSDGSCKGPYKYSKKQYC